MNLSVIAIVLIFGIIVAPRTEPKTMPLKPPIQLFGVDAFTDRPFAGNPAAVCLLDHEQDAKWMQAVAAEMNLSETAFIRPIADKFELRWFTPKIEVDLCGHATMASAHVLWQAGLVPESKQIHFSTRSGILTAEKSGDLIELDFPATPPTEAIPPEGLLEALGVVATFVGRSRFDYLIEVATADEVRTLKPDFSKLGTVEARGIIVTSKSDDTRFDFISRFFAPSAGIDEDPVTGSAHCCLGPYWKERLGRESMAAYQASERGGVVQVRVGADRIILGGKAVTVWRGELSVVELPQLSHGDRR